jgi:hypothetical protein
VVDSLHCLDAISLQIPKFFSSCGMDFSERGHAFGVGADEAGVVP